MLDKSSWAVGGGVILGLGVGFFLLEQSALYFVHLSLPHFPFTYDHLGQSHRDNFRIPDARFRKATGSNTWASKTAADLAYQAHLLQLSFTDLLLGRIAGLRPAQQH